MMLRRLRVASLAFGVFVVSGMPLDAQQPRPRGPELPMSPRFESGQPVSPIFEGWYQNPDGTYTLSFGFFNRNSAEDLEVPIGPDNFIEPAEFDGDQPTTFSSESESGYTGRGWGVFTVVVPEDWSPDQDVVWTLRSKGVTHSVPGRVGNAAYRLTEVDVPQGVGSLPPSLRFEQNGEEGLGPKGLWAEGVRTTSVGDPLSLSVWVADRWDPESRDIVPVDVRWFKYRGPVDGTVEFEERDVEVEGEGGSATSNATFSAPGEYVLRARAGNFSARDSTLRDHCCWTNGYVRVTVTP